ncbi:MAG TPA: transglutaminase-like cysteine peptidase [Microvirga sp.]|nr:transglutaminase-like cysteine peptidase [Microvirga sp.]
MNPSLRGVAAACVLMGGIVLGHEAAAKPVQPVSLTPERMAELRQVNQYVNSTIVEVTDLEQYGREDVWALPTSGKGDCEDFALLKRKMLIERGWPASTLSVTVGATGQGVAHAVLMVTTAQGQWVLDNLTSSILPPSRTGHVYYARQSGKGWLSATGERSAEPMADLPVARRSPVVQASARERRG